jgi:hypothetical protein
MSGWSLPCGCSGSSSMFGEREIFSISCCMRHAQNPELQIALRAATQLLHRVTSNDPGHWDYERGWVTD